MEGRACERAGCPFAISVSGRSSPTDAHVPEADQHIFVRILRQVDRGEWDLPAWAEELGISEDEMLIEIDRHLYHPPAP